MLGLAAPSPSIRALAGQAAGAASTLLGDAWADGTPDLSGNTWNLLGGVSKQNDASTDWRYRRREATGLGSFRAGGRLKPQISIGRAKPLDRAPIEYLPADSARASSGGSAPGFTPRRPAPGHPQHRPRDKFGRAGTPTCSFSMLRRQAVTGDGGVFGATRAAFTEQAGLPGLQRARGYPPAAFQRLWTSPGRSRIATKRHAARCAASVTMGHDQVHHRDHHKRSPRPGNARFLAVGGADEFSHQLRSDFSK